MPESAAWVITDKLKSYGAAKAEVLPGVEHWQVKYQNDRGGGYLRNASGSVFASISKCVS